MTGTSSLKIIIIIIINIIIIIIIIIIITIIDRKYAQFAVIRHVSLFFVLVYFAFSLQSYLVNCTFAIDFELRMS